ncbi:MAG TPA: bifunctional diaminohydroxyphosphoribosylaminopyrimidine deaminase/5-amino-6-(5-phosphoribosylamino)uracil reductase RibD [Acidobacteriota bacterium]|nr:bifunctional diaminohydroxyphosphoribosylaminopyrimidine deaminase/5-amino-6-(5-phosphoribosylamino)uracil reductase RibD [Acidobacteriota bacterium]
MFMKRALRLARKGRGLVSPNPMVGAVVVRNGRVVGEGFHRYDQVDHAEAIALRWAGELARGATLYVTLEPCSHQGRTPPCVEATLQAGITRVVVGCADPNPRVGGAGIERLRTGGVSVEVGTCRADALRLNEVFFHFVQTAKPFMLLKLALTLDGRIAAPNRTSRWITGESARRLVQRTRFECDAVLIGSGTLLADDPDLSVRSRRNKSIRKVILDSRLRTPPQARIFQSGDPVTIFHAPEAAPDRVESLRRKVADLIEVEREEAGLRWDRILDELASRGVTSVLAEGGAQVAASLVEKGLPNRYHLYYGPKLVGSNGVASFGPLSVDSMEDAAPLVIERIRRLGPDLLIDAVPGGGARPDLAR